MTNSNIDKLRKMSNPNIEKLRELSGHLTDPEIAIAIFEHMPDAVIVVDESGDIQLVNQQAELLFGYSRLQLFDAPVETLVPEGLRERHAQHREEYVQEPRARPMAHDLALRARRKNGSEFTAEINLSPIPTSLGTLVMAVVRRRRDGTS